MSKKLSTLGVGTTFEAVSYTHLDVYKRQHLQHKKPCKP